MEEGTICIAESESLPIESTELKFYEGDILIVYPSEGDWWYAECVNSNNQGWFDPKVCRKICPPLLSNNINESDRIKYLYDIFNEIISTQQNYINILNIFMNYFIKPFTLRDTPFKRSFLDNPSVALITTLVPDIYTADEIFLKELLSLSNEKSASKSNDIAIKLATCYANHAPSMQLYSRYASELVNLMYTIDKFAKQLNEFFNSFPFPNDISFESCLYTIQGHFKSYYTLYEKYVRYLLTNDTKIFIKSIKSLSIVLQQTDLVESRLKKDESKVILLALHNRFVGHTEIFKEGRRLLKEGELEKVRKINKNNADNIELKSYYLHLFNDCLMYSNKKSSNNTFKLKKAIPLVSIDDTGGGRADAISVYPIAYNEYNMNSIFGISSRTDSDINLVFKCRDDNEMNEWIKEIKLLLSDESLKKVQRQQRNSVIQLMKLPGVNVANLGPRATCIYKFLESETDFSESLLTLHTVFIQPLINCSKGAPLIVGSNNSKIKSTSVNSLLPNSQITELLQDASIQIFLQTFDNLKLLIPELITKVIDQCQLVKWNESIIISSIFISSLLNSIYKLIQSYSNSINKFLYLFKLNNLILNNFYYDCELIIMNNKGKLVDKINLPLDRINIYYNFIINLSKISNNLVDENKLLVDISDNLIIQYNNINNTIKYHKNFEKLLIIQKSITSTMKATDNDSFLSKLASYDRLFIKEGELKKVCRRKNKLFHFWLFNDYLCYGESSGIDTYILHRYIDLSKCTVTLHEQNDLKHAIDIYASEKSFIVIASTQILQIEWFNVIFQACETIRSTAPENDHEIAVAPIWVPDTIEDKCCICKSDFNIWRRRHHCRKCGRLVCGNHSKNKMILSFIHESQTHRVCDDCYQNKDQDFHNNETEVVKAKRSSVAATSRTSIVSAPLQTPPLLSNQSEFNKTETKNSSKSLPTKSVMKSSGTGIINRPAPMPTQVAKPPTPVSIEVNKPTNIPAPVVKVPPPITNIEPKTKTGESPKPLISQQSIYVAKESNNPFGEELPDDIPPPLPTSPPPPLPSSPPPPLPVFENIEVTAPVTSRWKFQGNTATASPPVKPVRNNSRANIRPPPVPPSLPTENKPPSITTSNEPISENNVIMPVVKAPPPVPVARPPIPEAVTLLPKPPIIDNTVPTKAIVQPPPVPVKVTPLASPAIPPKPPVIETKQESSAAPLPPTLPLKQKESNTLTLSPEQIKYLKLKDLIPEGAFRQKMKSDGYSEKDIDHFISTSELPAQSASESNSSTNNPLSKYEKMKGMMPEGAIRQKMRMDGFTDEIIDLFLLGGDIDISSLPTKPVSNENNSLLSGLSNMKLKSAEPTTNAPVPQRRVSIFDEIASGGTKLKAVQKDDGRMKLTTTPQSGGGLLDTLAVEMFKRRIHVQQEDDDSDSDGSGFSDTDSDSD